MSHRPLEGLAMAGAYPDSQIPRARSARQQFWLDHLRVKQTQETSLRAYAAANGLSSSSLHRAHRRFKRRGVAEQVHAVDGRSNAAPSTPARLRRLNASVPDAHRRRWCSTDRARSRRNSRPPVRRQPPDRRPRTSTPFADGTTTATEGVPTRKPIGTFRPVAPDRRVTQMTTRIGFPFGSEHNVVAP